MEVLMQRLHQHLVTRKGFMNGDTLTNDYRNWIVTQVSSNANPATGYSKLLDYLFHRDFSWYVRNDENRAVDGKQLRCDYERVANTFISPSFYDQPANVLEVLAALAIRCESHIMGEPGDEHPDKWFWLYLQNLGLLAFDDSHYNEKEVDRIVGDWIHRRYNKDGFGGIFPVENCGFDQRKTELWLQMHQYLMRNFPIM